MDGDSDISMVDAPEPSPRPAGASVSGPPQNYPTPIFASGLEKYRRLNQPAQLGNLLQLSMTSNSYKPICRGLTPPSKLAKGRQSQSLLAPATRGPNFFNTPKGSTASFKNPRIRAAALPYVIPQNTPRRLSPSDYRRRLKALQTTTTNPKPYPFEKTGDPKVDLHMYFTRARLMKAEEALSPEDRLKAQKMLAKRPAEESEESEQSASKRARIIETQGAAVPSTPVRRMPGAFPESPEHDYAPFDTQQLSLPASQTAAAQNIALAGLSMYARIRRITGVVRGAHRALKQGIRASTRFATAVGQRIRATHEPIPTVVVEERQETPETYESAISAASDQLQADLTAHAGALPPHHDAIPAVDPSAQLQAELVDHASHIPQLSTIVTTPTPSTVSANLLVQDQSSIQEEIMSEPSVTLPEQPTTTTIDATNATVATTTVEVPAAPTSTTVQSTSTSLEVEAFVEENEDDDLDLRRMHELFDRTRDRLGRPRREPSRYYLRNRRLERPPPVTPSETSLDAEVINTELAQENEEQSQDIASVSGEEHPTVEMQHTTQVEEQQVEDQQVEGQRIEEQHIQMQQIQEPQVEEQEVQEGKEAAEGPIRQFLAAMDEFEAAKADPAGSAAARRSILKRRYGDNPNQRRLSATIQETVTQLAATTVRDEVPEIPRPTRHVHWSDEGSDYIDFVVPSAVKYFYIDAPPNQLWRGREPRDRAGFEAYEADLRRQDEIWERNQRQQIVKQREEALGRVGVSAGEPVVRPLPQLWQDRLSVAMRSSPDDVLVKTARADLTHQKLETCWTRLAWLNDEVINAHLDLTVKYLRRQANNLGPNDAPKYHAFNSFFYKNLREEGYQKVSRWATRVKIGGSALLNLETVFIPVHEGMHWTLLVVSPRMRTIEYFDSLGGRADSFVANIRLWLQGELGAAYNESEWIFLNTPSPQQDNGSDCGVFLLTSAKAIALGLKPTVYGPRDIGLIRMKIVAELMNNGLHGELDPRGSSGVVQL
ncbi:hypothetical protein EIK77_005415 [Talaromyces pinophilus]|nr:hypothetical protein EIK77_005415 [Talaromyces pinophilus]PCG97304.1 Peptidase C48, SUMO/Sentrin/Ubl1 [Penicillium occitanis (nom. inval.)]PCG97716.1 hypothetical protein PENOC_066630 [Penicillium occitanis (nom. inval.)]